MTILQEPISQQLNRTVAVHCGGVTKSYEAGGAKVTALRGIDVDIHTGELMMLVGPSGCGKTTLISVIAGILDHDDGVCNVFDMDFKTMGDRRRTAWRGKNIGFVFQAFNLLPTLTAVENVAVPMLINGYSRRDAIAHAEESMRRVGLQDRMKSFPRQLSGGQQQRVAIARALVHSPRLIVCDEPTSALDHVTGQKVMELLSEVAVGDDRALVIVTHDSRIFEFADRVARMDDGHIIEVTDN